jgi:aminomethyltransferase
MAEDELYVVTNAGPIEHVTARLQENNPGLEHVSYETAKIDVQGPLSRDKVLAAGFDAAASLKYFNATWTRWEGTPVVLSRTGYTGELGYEIFLPNELAVRLWNVFLEMDDVEPAGLGARDTLRTEVGYNLSGQDFSETISPLEASMASFVAWEQEFVGSKALKARRDAGDYLVQVAVASPDRRAPRHDFEVYDGDSVVGLVTSGTFGPSVGHGVGLARVQAGYSAIGTELTAGARRLPLTVVELPFYKHGTCRMKVG